MERQRILVIGNAFHPDFADAYAEIRRAAQVWFVPNGEYAAAWLGTNRPVDWVVLAQSRPGELPRDIVRRLESLAGQARFVSLLGSWCEGELRSGKPWPEVSRCYWYEFNNWWRSMNEGATGSASVFSPGSIAVSAVDYETADTLMDAFASDGQSAIWWPRHRTPPLAAGIAAGIWVGGQLNGQEAVQLDGFCRRMRSDRAPIVALLDFPRRDRVELARRIGVSKVLGKPWQVSGLTQTLRELVAARQFAPANHKLAIWPA